jgi:nucleotide-binding universal stress UspA family protein
MISINRILCPVDFFPASKKAVNYAAGLGAIYGAKIQLLHAVTPVALAAYEFPVDVAAIAKTMREASSREMEKLASRLTARGLNVETDVRVGTIHDAIRRSISRFKPDLIAMGTHGRTGIDRWFLGSVTEWWMRHSPVPVLAISAKERLRSPAFRRILVTTDLSDGTTDALDYAFSIAQENESRITLLHVVHDLGADVSTKYRDSVVRGVEGNLDKLIPAEAWDWCDIRTKVEIGHPYRVIERTLDKDKPDLLVMNIHGKGMLDRALLGSTAERVVRSAKCPVLLIPPMKKVKAARKPRKRAA